MNGKLILEPDNKILIVREEILKPLLNTFVVLRNKYGELLSYRMLELNFKELVLKIVIDDFTKFLISRLKKETLLSLNDICRLKLGMILELDYLGISKNKRPDLIPICPVEYLIDDLLEVILRDNLNVCDIPENVYLSIYDILTHMVRNILSELVVNYSYIEFIKDIVIREAEPYSFNDLISVKKIIVPSKSFKTTRFKLYANSVIIIFERIVKTIL